MRDSGGSCRQVTMPLRCRVLVTYRILVPISTFKRRKGRAMSRLAILTLLALFGWFCSGVALGDEEKPESAQDIAKQVTEIRLERSGGQDGPEDILTLRRDGTALYVGKKNVERVGRYKGTISEHGFHDNFPLLAETYASLHGKPLSTGKPTGGRVTSVTIHIVWDGKRKEIVDLCPGMDRRLWLLEMAARGLAADIAWKKDEPKKP